MTKGPAPDRSLDSHRLVVGIVLVTLILTGPVVGLDVTREAPELGDGTATVSLLSDPPSTLSVTDGRFGTNVPYVRIPDAVVDVRDLDGSPRLVYSLTVPELGVDRTLRRVLTDEGRVTLRLADRALAPDTEAGTYSGRVVLRLQSFSGQEILVNRSVEVTVP